MLLATLLKKHFDIVICTETVEVVERGNSVSKEINQIWIYEIGFDCEPLLILKDGRELEGFDGWVVGNIYSNLEQNSHYTDEELKTLVKAGAIKSQFS